MYPKIEWPNRKKFAFTIIDDTDQSTIANTRPVYRLLEDLGLYTTKTVWPLRPQTQPDYRFGTLQDPRYCDWILSLLDRGFEIGFHGAADEPSTRNRVIEALDYFRGVTGADPRVHANHVGQFESLYWYHNRVTGPLQLLLRAGEKLKHRRAISLGHKIGSDYFWGDIARSRIEYVRNFTFSDVNTLKMNPWMPYHSLGHPYVKYWFSASHGADCQSFNALLDEAAQDRLLSQGGCSIVYTHFGINFVRDGKVDSRFAALMRRLSAMGGYFAPVSTLLDFLRRRRQWKPELDLLATQRLQYRWMCGKWRLHTV